MNEALVVLVLVWAVLLVPGAIRARRTSPHATVGGFERAMEVLRGEAGSAALTPHPPAGRTLHRRHAPSANTSSDPRQGEYRIEVAVNEDPVVARRRVWFVRALAVSGAAFLLGLIGGGRLWLVFLVTALVTAGYALVLRRLKLQRDEARRVVRGLDLHRAATTAAAPLVHADAAGAGGASVATAGSFASEDAGGWQSTSVRLRRWDD